MVIGDGWDRGHSGDSPLKTAGNRLEKYPQPRRIMETKNSVPLGIGMASGELPRPVEMLPGGTGTSRVGNRENSTENWLQPLVESQKLGV